MVGYSEAMATVGERRREEVGRSCETRGGRKSCGTLSCSWGCCLGIDIDQHKQGSSLEILWGRAAQGQSRSSSRQIRSDDAAISGGQSNYRKEARKG